MNTLGQNNEEDICILSNFTGFKYVWPWLWPQSHIRYLKYWFKSAHHTQLTLTLDFNVISIFWHFCCNLHMIGNHCGEYVHARWKLMKEVFAFWALDRLYVCSTLTFDHKVISTIWNLRLNQQIIRNCCAKYELIPSIHQRGVCSMSSVTVFKNIWLWPLISRSYPYSETFVVIYPW